jgi:ribosomal protein S18 acetylase RimI-like enzyme
VAGSVTARRIGADALPDALALLAEAPRENLLLLDLASRLGEAPPPGELATELVGMYRRGELLGVATLRPTIGCDAHMPSDAVDALLPLVESLDVGLLKSEPGSAGRLWDRVAQRRRRRVWIDRFETLYAVSPEHARLVDEGEGCRVRSAEAGDLEALVFAARESLREEQRPDPFAGDARGFRRWVSGRLPRARLVESDGRVCFVGYADVQRHDGWLLQGIYTWPDVRRRGNAAVGTSALCREAFASGADHVQLAVVDGNEGALQLYARLGFESCGRIRTILFT